MANSTEPFSSEGILKLLREIDKAESSKASTQLDSRRVGRKPAETCQSSPSDNRASFSRWRTNSHSTDYAASRAPHAKRQPYTTSSEARRANKMTSECQPSSATASSKSWRANKKFSSSSFAAFNPGHSSQENISSYYRKRTNRYGEDVDCESISSVFSDVSRGSGKRNKMRDSNSTRMPIKFMLSSNKKNHDFSDSGAGEDYDTRFVGYKYLKELSEKKAHEILCEITKPNTAFEAFLSSNELEADWLFLILEIIKQLCLSDFAGNKNELFNRIVCHSQLVRCISYYLGEIAFETEVKTIRNLKTFIEDLTVLFTSVIDTLPMVAYENDFKKIIMKTVMAVETINTKFRTNVEETTVKKLNILVDRLDDYKNLLENKSIKKDRSYQDRMADVAPPEDFRELTLFPTYEELRRTHFGFVRPNKVKGAYHDVEHYLDVQFRLLREDFIDPLRSGLRKYAEEKLVGVKGKMKSKYENLRLYRRTIFERLEVTKSNQVGLLLNFDPNRRLKIKWEYSKRLMFGSLLLFTTNDFETFFHGTVLDRNLMNLAGGRILVRLPHDVLVDEDFFKQEYLMAESEVFFEPYNLVLGALKTFSEYNFPMTKYIVFGEQDTAMPAYLSKFKEWDILGFNLQPLQTDGWPSAKDIGLDDSQYEAFRTALTSDFCVIQGPPGTGKTFIGLKIVEVLLANKTESTFRDNFQQAAIHTPILVVCYTNHALDQFLEGILKYTNKIVRAGSQSKNEALSPYNLRGQRQLSIRRQASDVHHAMAEVKHKVEKTLLQIQCLNVLKNKVDTPEGILSYDLVAPVMEGYQKSFIGSNADLIEWLLPIWQQEDLFDEESDDEQPTNFELQTSGVVNGTSEENNLQRHSSIENFGYMDELIEESVLDQSSEPPPSQSCYCKILNDVILQYRSLTSQYAELKESRVTERMDGHYVTWLNKKYELKRSIKMKVAELKILRFRLINPYYDPEKIALILKTNFQRLNADQRWLLYWHWVVLLREDILQKINKAQEDYRSKVEQYEEYKQIEDLHVVQNAKVVGMTTTCAARLHVLLQSMKPQIVIIEEAAEVLEAHIVASLTGACEHVILIGDHKQLKPSAAVNQLCTKYNLDVSLFERMINNGMYCPTLNIQHRMRPEISKLITPLIYPNLKNHESVLKYKSIRGMTKNIFFFDHSEPEEQIDESNSRKNLFEADFVLELCRYLILQGYDTEKITILTTYAGQMYSIREKKKTNQLLQAVRCIVVDKYQGEENDIILLSLVRSNKEAKIGFLKTENRVCVALSRAREALYVIGNMDNLCQSSPMWMKIKEILEEQNAIGKEIDLYCKKHEITSTISKLDDFDKVRQGGCNVRCGELMACGHNCKSSCHTMDIEHKEIKCREDCPKMCPKAMHPCKLLCFQGCNLCTVKEERLLPCGHTKLLACYTDETTYKCDEMFDEVLAICGHTIRRKCSEKPEDVPCQTACDARLDCGHVCPQKCHKTRDPDHLEFKCQRSCERLNEDCSKEHKCAKLCFENCGLCTVLVNLKLPCSHEHRLPCSTDINAFPCFKKCEKFCSDCKTKCRKKCHQDCSPCMIKVEKTVDECGHKIKIPCFEEPTRELCYQPCNSKAPCGHDCKAICSKPCGTEKCREVIKHQGVRGLCGHNFVKILCHQQNDVWTMDRENLMQYCDEPCKTKLKCGDVCSGTCGQCWQGRLHKSCTEKCGKTLICGHSCKYPCREVCPPCQETCVQQCKHSKCTKKCGVPCVSCQENCDWKCKHSKCTKKCGQKCNRLPCYEPCEEKLECGHSCIGFCGDPCPKECRICNPEILEIFLGHEDEPDARFVLLEDCGHAIESKGLEMHLGTAQGGGEIVLKRCPTCSTPITTTLRYMNYVKKTYEHIAQVKKKIFGHGKLLYQKRDELYDNVRKLIRDSEEIIKLFPDCTNHLNGMMLSFMDMLFVHRNKQIVVSSAQLSAINYFIELFVTIIARLDDLTDKTEEIHEYVGGRQMNRGRGNRPQPQLKRRMVTKRKFVSTDTARKTINFLQELLHKAGRIGLKMNQQQSEDIDLEINRFSKMVDLCLVLRDPLYNESYLDVVSIYKKIENVLFVGSARFSSEVLESVNRLFADLQKALKSDRRLTNEEKTMIHKAMSKNFNGGGPGHWFTCSKGHYYCITECGGAMEESNCPECGEKIGGRNHRSVETARLASDMDGATSPAWGAGNDLRNFQI